MLGFLHLKKFAPEADELFAELVRRHVLRRGDDVRDAVLHAEAGHSQRLVEGTRTIIDIRQNMAV